MHSRKIGPLTVSAVGLGCMNMSMGYGPADRATSQRLLAEALEQGYRFFDTATVYGSGHNESLIGEVLAPRRSEFVLASKCCLSRSEAGEAVVDGRPETLKRQCEQSLKRLQTDVIDLYYIHRLDVAVPIEESVGALADMVVAGKIRAIGLSEMASDTLRRAHAEHPIAAMQTEYSLWSRTPERGILATCEELGVTLVPFAPLGRGFLAGSAQDVSQLTSDDIRATNARPRFEAEAFARNSTLLPAFNAVAAREGCSPAQLALAWLLAQEDSQGRKTLVPIPGTKQVEHMRDNGGASELLLTAAVIAELDALINPGKIAGERYTAAIMSSIDSERD